LGASVTFSEATAPVKLPTRHCPSVLLRLEPKTDKGGISTAAPPRLASKFQSLPPILHMPTAPVKLPTRHCLSVVLRLEPKTDKGGISTAAPPRLASKFQSLPPILHMPTPSPIPGYSKAPQGLFVPCRVSSDPHEWLNDLAIVSTEGSVKLRCP